MRALAGLVLLFALPLAAQTSNAPGGTTVIGGAQAGTGPASGSCSGDLTGTYPNCVVSKINGQAVGAVAAAASPVQSVNGATGAVLIPIPVQSVNGHTGPVSLGPADVGAPAAANNLSDLPSPAAARANLGGVGIYPGVYSQNATYGAGDEVSDSAYNNIYKSLVSGNTGNPLTDTAHWLHYASLSNLVQGGFCGSNNGVGYLMGGVSTTGVPQACQQFTALAAAWLATSNINVGIGTVSVTGNTVTIHMGNTDTFALRVLSNTGTPLFQVNPSTTATLDLQNSNYGSLGEINLGNVGGLGLWTYRNIADSVTQMTDIQGGSGNIHDFATGSPTNPSVKSSILQNGVLIQSALAGTGNAYACLDSTGTLYRSATVCQ